MSVQDTVAQSSPAHYVHLQPCCTEWHSAALPDRTFGFSVLGPAVRHYRILAILFCILILLIILLYGNLTSGGRFFCRLRPRTCPHALISELFQWIPASRVIGFLPFFTASDLQPLTHTFFEVSIAFGPIWSAKPPLMGSSASGVKSLLPCRGNGFLPFASYSNPVQGVAPNSTQPCHLTAGYIPSFRGLQG